MDEGMDRDARMRDNRARFPEFSAFVDAVRQVFGDDVKVVWAKEGSNVVGKVPLI